MKRVPPVTAPKFTKDNQPSPKAKSEGWKKLRSEKLLAREILKIMFDVKGNPKAPFHDFLKSIIDHAQKGNPKAIDIVWKSIEDTSIKADIDDQIIVIVPSE